MRKWRRAVLTCCIALSLTGCGFADWDSRELLEFADNLVGKLGDSQITPDEDLFGKRFCYDDVYTGSYRAQCQGSTGKDVIFGGASIESRKLQVHGRIVADSGRAAVRIRMNDEVAVLETDEEGYFETQLHLASGGNYIMVDYEDFSGTVELNSVQLPLDWDGKDVMAFNR